MFRAIEFKEVHACGARRRPVTLAIISDVQRFVRAKATPGQRAPVNLRIGFIGAEFAGEKDVAEIGSDFEMLKDGQETAVEI